MVIFLAKCAAFFIRLFSLGSGATWPGEIALRLQPGILSFFSKQNAQVIVVAGTNGKTTTVKMIETMLSGHQKKVVRNSTGANLDNGLVSTFLEHSNITGKLVADYFIFEVDEATLPNIIEKVHPKIIVLLNLFRDQLDRYGEVDAIVEKWLPTLQEYLRGKTGVSFIVNADDPALAFLASKVGHQTMFFGLEDPELFLPKMQHATDSIFCPKCGTRLTFGGVYFSHLGKYACGQCGFTHPGPMIRHKDVKSPLPGVYNVYNTMAATLVGQSLGFSPESIQESLTHFTPAFGRMETLEYQGKSIKILLSKNPTGFNESLRTALASKHVGPILLVLNDRIPDGRDVSWIWDVDFELLEASDRTIVISGDRCHDLAVRLKYADILTSTIKVSEDLSVAIDTVCDEAKSEEEIWILATYSAMLECRKIIVGRKIL